VHALIPLTRRFSYLEEGDVAEISLSGVRIVDGEGKPVERAIKTSTFNADAAQKGDYAHYMLKEIHEQPQAVADTLEGRISGGHILTQIFGVDAAELLAKTEAVHIIACGTSYHAGLVARYWIEQLAGVPCSTEIASEYRYRDPVVKKGTLYLTISQSGETADTLAALKLAGQRDYLTRMAICNVPESSIVREAQLVLMTRAGPEIGVASTKAFTTQLVALALFTLELARAKGVDAARYEDGVRQLEHLPALIGEALKLDSQVRRWPRTSSTSSTRCSSAVARTGRWRWKARSSSRKSPTSTPRPTPPASSSTARWRWSMPTCR
jgi:glucosamine--fructose-6-phosphate aminotransferase (isomerizing)